LNDWIGCMEGHLQANTPNIDRLVARGTLFANAYCQAPVCGPSRGSFLSGRYPHETGLYNQPSGNSLADDATDFDNHLLPQYLAQKGSSGPKPTGQKKPNDVRFQYRPNYDLPYISTQTDWGVFPKRNDQMPDFQSADWIIPQIQKKHA
jgi:hypothetical protein